jgi:hypothetical protein
MLRFVARHGLVRLVGGRAVPALMIFDLLVLANRTRRIPMVDRGLRRGARAVRSRVVAAVDGLPARPTRPARPGRSARSDRDGDA